VPFWAKDPSIGSKMINARAETLAEKTSFKRPFATKRCIVPADGFYEWKKVDGHKRKQPMFLTTIDGSPFAFAGLWEVWSKDGDVDATGEPRQLFSCTIVTCEANATIADVHDRMPVMLPPDAWDTWLDRDNRDLEALQTFSCLRHRVSSGCILCRPRSTMSATTAPTSSTRPSRSPGG
jgi:putative SOS response-associated peptidase YedK